MPALRHLQRLCAAALAAACGLAAADTLDKLMVGKSIHLGYRPNSAPFSFAREKSEAPAGYAVDLCKLFAEMLARELKIPLQQVWVPVGPNERNAALADGLVDIDCADSTVTNQAQKEVAFTIPIFVAATRLMVAGKVEGTDLGLLQGKRIVTTSQSGNEAMLRHVLGQTGVAATVQVARTHRAALEVLRKGEAQALFADDATLFAIRLAPGGPGDVTVLQKTYSMRPKAIAFRRDEPRLRALLSREMRSLIASGALPRLHEQWFNSTLASHGVNLGVPLSYLLRETWKVPSDSYVDHAYGHLPD
jgi:ABC-type amino acid transport substrate-binding protein